MGLLRLPVLAILEYLPSESEPSSSLYDDS